MDLILIKLDELEKCWYETSQLEKFLQEHDIEHLLEQLLNDKNENVQKKLMMFFRYISKEKTFYKQFLFHKSQTYAGKVERLLVDPQVQYQILVANSINANSEELHSILKQIVSDHQQFSVYINVVFYLLNHYESEVGLQVLKSLINMSKIDNNCIFSQELFVQNLQKGLDSSNSEVQIRFAEFIIEATNHSQALQLFYVQKGIIEKTILLYQTDDLLMKLNVVEMISRMGNSSWNSTYISNHGMFHKLMIEAFDIDNQEFYLRKNLVQLISKMIAFGIVKVNLNLQKNIVNFIGLSLHSTSKEEIDGGLETIQYISCIKDGISILIKNKDVFSKYMEFSQSSYQNQKIKFLASFASIFQQDANKKQSQLAQIFYCLGSPQSAQSLNFDQVEKNIIDDKAKSITKLFTFLQNPIPEIEIEALKVLTNISQYYFGILEMSKSPKLIDYLTKEHASQKENFDSKKDLVGFLLKELSQMNEKDQIIIDFHQNLLKSLKEKSIQQFQVASEFM